MSLATAAAWLDAVGSTEMCYLTTRGRVSGRPHTIEIWFGQHLGRVYILSGGLERVDWVRNIQAHAPVQVRIGDATWQGVGRLVADPTEDALARRLLFEKYDSETDRLEEWARTALPVAVDLQEPVSPEA